MIYGYDKSKWPLVILTVEGKPQSTQEMENLLREWEELYEESKNTDLKFKFIIDVRELGGADFKYLVMIGKFLTKVKKLTEEWMDRTAIMVSSNAIKFLIKFVFKIYKPVRPFKVFNKAEETLIWVTSKEEGDSEEEINKLKEKKEVKDSKIDFS